MPHTLSGQEILAIDAGTQGVALILWDPNSRSVLGVGDRPYAHDYTPGLPDGQLEQQAHYWSDAIRLAMADLREDVKKNTGSPIDAVAAIGVTGHMHCMVRKDANDQKPFGCDMWNDPRGVPESEELTALLGEHIPARWTACHILARMRSDPTEWAQATGVTVTSGSIVHDLTGQWVLGPGDASGMFGSLGPDGQIDRDKLRKIDNLTNNQFTPLEQLVPTVIPAGQVAGTLTPAGSELLGGLPVGTPVAPPEGDQQSVLVVAAVDELELALSAGTSFTGNLPCTTDLKATGEAVNVLAGPDGKTMLMVCCRSGTVAFAQYVTGLSKLANQPFATIADDLTDLAAAATPDADGPLLWGFFQGENVTDLPHAKASLQHLSIDAIANPGLLAYLLLESPCLTLRYGLEQLKPHTGPIKRVVMTGGALKSKDGFAPQLYADLLGVPIHANAGDQEGSAKGAALLAAYTAAVKANTAPDSFAEFAKSQTAESTDVWQPNMDRHKVLNHRYQRFAEGVAQMQSA
ncbi:MAG: FGGY-family carbohydrate kinase [Planctomycetota bacterium]